MQFCEIRQRRLTSGCPLPGLRGRGAKAVFRTGSIATVCISTFFLTAAFGNEPAPTTNGTVPANERGGASANSSLPSEGRYRPAFRAVWQHNASRHTLPGPMRLRTRDDRNRFRERTFGIAFPHLSESERRLLERVLLETARNGTTESAVTAPAREGVERAGSHESWNGFQRETFFDADAYWDAMLVAGGADEATRLRQRGQIAAISAGLPAFMQIPSPYDADRLLAHLHRTCFTGGYAATASVLSEPLERRAFNCVSASLLYYGLARQLGWSVRIHLSTGHMRCSVRTTDGDYTIETVDFPPNLLRRLRGGVAGGGDGGLASAGGERAGATSQRAMRIPLTGDDSAIASIGANVPSTGIVPVSVSIFDGDFASVSRAEPVPTTEPASGPWMEWQPWRTFGGVTPHPVEDERAVESLAVLESVLFHNRALTALEAGEPERSLACSAAAVWLDPDSAAARSNFIASLNNVAICYVQSGRAERGEPWLRMACEMAPDHPILAENYQKLQHRLSKTPETGTATTADAARAPCP